MYGISVRFSGQLGNQMFQYALGKLLAKQSGLAFVPGISDFRDRQGKALRWAGSPLFRPVKSPGRWLSQTPTMIQAVHWADLSGVTGRCPVALRGYFQRYELYQPWKDEIRNDWLKLPAEAFVVTDPAAVYVHARRTDYVDGYCGIKLNNQRQCTATSIDEFAIALKKFDDVRRLVVLTDNPGDEFFQQFNKLGIPWAVEPGGWETDFCKLASCRNLLMSQSTFSWWAGFLGKAQRIVCPVFPDSYWHFGLNARGAERAQHPNLFVDDEADRWCWVVS